jgi:hypothetical protein
LWEEEGGQGLEKEEMREGLKSEMEGEREIERIFGNSHHGGF